MLVFLVSVPAALADGGVIAVLKSPTQVERRDAATGRYIGAISVSNAERIGTDGTTIAVQQTSGNIMRYEAKTGRYIGNINPGNGPFDGLQVNSGVIVVITKSQLRRYDAKTGRYLGATSR